jgi:hypothetical protein
MSKTVGTILAAVVWLAGFAISICIASIPKWNEWPVEEVRTILCDIISIQMINNLPKWNKMIIFSMLKCMVA